MAGELAAKPVQCDSYSVVNTSGLQETKKDENSNQGINFKVFKNFKKDIIE